MNMAFLRRAEWILEERHFVRLDHALLVNALAAQQTANLATRLHAVDDRLSGDGEDDPLIELLIAGPGWRRAAWRQRGCFSRAEAGRRLNGS